MDEGAGLREGPDGLLRCGWPGTEHDDYRAYHDHEWARPVHDDARLFEKICLEGFQAGLSWLTILRKRDRFREVFAGFDARVVAGFDEHDVERLLDDPGIVRHRGKIEATISNAGRCLELVEDVGSLDAYAWSWRPEPHVPFTSLDAVPATTVVSHALSKDLRRRGWRFVGPTTAYAFMQAMGLVNDHLAGCVVHDDVAALQDREPVGHRAAALARPFGDP